VELNNFARQYPIENILKRIRDALILKALYVIGTFLLIVVDVALYVANHLFPKRSVGEVIQKGYPGHKGDWGTYEAPKNGDSRSPCPGLNSLANHGIIKRDGKRILFSTIAHALQHTYNLSPTLAWQLTASVFVFSKGGYIDLGDICAHNIVEHDASLTRQDAADCPDQSKPDPDLINAFLSYAKSPKITLNEIALFAGHWRYNQKQKNGQYSLDLLHKIFGSGNCALMYDVFDGNVRDLRTWLTEEKFPAYWEPKTKQHFGVTIVDAQLRTWAIELRIVEDTASPKPIALNCAN